jgi:hypothetical protein
VRHAAPLFADSTQSASPRGVRRRCRILALGCTSILTLLALTGPVGPANAANINVFDYSFNGSDAVGAAAFGEGSLQALDIDQSTGAVYVATTNGVVYKFNSAGVSQPFGGGPNTVFSQSIGSYGDIEVDNSGTATQGRIYTVNDSSEFAGFTSSGSALSGFPVNNTGETCGIAVGPDGHIWAARYPNTVREYDPSTAPPTFIKSVNFSPSASGICDFDMDSQGDFIVPQFYGGSTVYKYPPSGTGGTLIDGTGTSRSAAVDLSNDQIYVNVGNKVNRYDSTGGSPLDTFGLPDAPYPGLQSSLAIAVNKTTHQVYVGNNRFGSTRVEVFKPVTVPDVVTGDPEGNNVVRGTVGLAGAGEVTECYFQFGTSTEYELGDENCSPGAPYSEAKSVSATLPGLLGEQTYHYRLVAKNTNGKSVGADKTITPHYVEGLRTDDAENVTRTGARLKAHFTGNGEETKYYFEWGPAAGTYTAGQSAIPPGTNVGSPVGLTNLSYEASTLQPGTLYHYRVVASNPIGVSPGDDKTFKTLPAIQSLQTNPATGVGAKVATLNGSYLGDADTTSYYFKYGTSPSYGSTTPITSAGNPTGTTPLSASISGLDLEMTYHYRIVATNSLGTTEGADQTFKTDPAVLGLKTLPPTEISLDGVKLNAEFNGIGEETHYFFEYGLTNDYGKTSAAPPGNNAGSPVGVTQISSTIDDFEAYSTYHYRVVAENSQGITKGADQPFETPAAPLPTIDGPTVADIGPTVATLQASINPNRWATVYLFEYGPTAAYGESTLIGQAIASDQFAHPVSNVVSNLVPGTTYHVRAVAINFTGTSYSGDQVFTTPDSPRIEVASFSGVGQSSVHLAASVRPNSAATTVRFEYGTSASYGDSTTATPIGSDAGVYITGADVGGLTSGTTYHFRAVAGNAYGTTFGPDQTFATERSPGEQLVEVPAKKCKRGFVRRKDRCVKKPHRKKRHSGRHG